MEALSRDLNRWRDFYLGLEWRVHGRRCRRLWFRCVSSSVKEDTDCLSTGSPVVLQPACRSSWRCHASGQLGHGDMRDRWAPVQIMRFKTNASKFYDLRMPFL